ncbi:WXG100 family type VII secretion target [Micromonospora sp. DT233]|uniref:WXG100 family type VII secretion target n=1 Tax=Micromonospora sp. DT233 TaxID=3393432 RepID=UPI003CF16883
MTQGQFQVTPAYVQQAAVDCDRVAADVQTQLSALQAFVQRQSETWQGISSQKFVEEMGNFHRHSINLHNALTEIGQGLRVNAANYVNAETDNLNNLSFSGGGPNPGGPQPANGNVVPPANL